MLAVVEPKGIRSGRLAGVIEKGLRPRPDEAITGGELVKPPRAIFLGQTDVSVSIDGVWLGPDVKAMGFET